MKTTIIAMALTMASFSTFAADLKNECNAEVLKIARQSMDQKAHAYGFESGAVEDETLSQVELDSDTGTATYLVDAAIYKGTYLVSVTVDSSCGLESLKITEY